MFWLAVCRYMRNLGGIGLHKPSDQDAAEACPESDAESDLCPERLYGARVLTASS
jgi:hypothetical protein